MSQTSHRRIPTGIRGFDSLVEGGLFEGRLYVLSGPPGSGKTTFSTQFLVTGAKEGKNCFFLTMHETKEELVNDMSRYDFGLDRIGGRGHIEFLNVFSDEGRRVLFGSSTTGTQSNPEVLAKRIVSFADSNNVDRVVIDSMMLLEHYFKEASEDVSRFLTELKQADATVILISEMTDPSAYTKEHYLGHGVIFMHNYLGADGMQRGVQIVKMRGTGIDCDIRPIRFTNNGIEVDAERKLEA